MVNYYIGIDFGGTKIAGGLVKNNKIVKKIKVATEAKKGKKQVLFNLEKAISFLLTDIDKKCIKGIGIGVPGVLDTSRSKIIRLPNVPGFVNVPLKKIIEKSFHLPVKLENDSSCFALGEAALGAGRGMMNVICLTLGTGLGGGIVFDRKLYTGRGSAGEIGHMVLNASGPKCACGNRGCWESYVASKAIARYSKEFLGKVYHPLEIEKMCFKGHKNAAKVYDKAGLYLGIGLVSLNNIFDPDMIIISGGLSNARKFLFDPAKKVLKERSLLKPTKVVKGTLGRDGGILGAAYLASC